MSGKVNVVSPAPVRNAVFMKMLRGAVGMPLGIPIGTTLLKVGAMLIGTETELVLKSRNVIPKRLTDAGFSFGYGDLGTALGNLTKT